MLSAIPSKVEYVRIIVTKRCNLRCCYCHEEGVAANDLQELPPEEVILLSRIAYDTGVRKFKLMGGEPTLREDLSVIIRGIKRFSEQIDVSMISNGILIKDFADEYKGAGIDRFNISLHGWNSERYRKVTGASESCLQKTKESILFLLERKMLSKLNYLLLKGQNETEFLDLIKWTSQYNVKLDVLNVLYSSKNERVFKPLFYSYAEIFDFIRTQCKVGSVRLVENPFNLPSTQVVLRNGGILNLKNYPLNKEMPFRSCAGCAEFAYCIEGIKAIRLTNEGKIKPCLFRQDNEFDLSACVKAEGYQGAVKSFSNYLSLL